MATPGTLHDGSTVIGWQLSAAAVDAQYTIFVIGEWMAVGSNLHESEEGETWIIDPASGAVEQTEWIESRGYDLQIPPTTFSDEDLDNWRLRDLSHAILTARHLPAPCESEMLTRAATVLEMGEGINV